MDETIYCNENENDTTELTIMHIQEMKPGVAIGGCLVAG
jgi:hypothetical protein